MQERLKVLMQRKSQLETEFNTMQTNLVMIQGNINELSFHIEKLVCPPKAPEPEPLEPAKKAEDE